MLLYGPLKFEAVFVSKMFAVEDSALPKHRKRYMFFLPTRDSSKAAIVKLIATERIILKILKN